ncbi:DUF3181 family protein [Acaryochloris sp. 'Moss Beach']|uniref:DUF3181 family protein n=1 Tax=Acaryochloris sp. 'Moss Beach' TaxID=2740837 RepID=UPI001F2B0EF4|nr:DUF3181 family protein [Acaryochloris sp. 'Moss Beach']UJB69326.1 DUF3181 family protein [Acaryochloris sp. 'Moss Beach']
MADQIATVDVEALAADIGEKIYIDVAKWHLFLSDAHLHQSLAEQFCNLLENGLLEEPQILQVLSDVSVPLGGGKCKLPLIDLMPVAGQQDLMGILTDFRHRLEESGYSF